MRLRAGALAFVLAVAPCQSVRLAVSQATSRLADESHSTACSTGVPWKPIFYLQWHAFMAKEERLSLQRKEAGPGAGPPNTDDRPPAVVIGVFSRAGCKDAPFREVIRTTWMSLPGVCKLSSSGPRANCSVYVTFVFGGGQANGEKDVTILPIKENINCGKTPSWFQHAATTYPWATHVAKMDMDAFLHVSAFVNVLRNFSSGCENVYAGHSYVSSEDRPWLPPKGCGHPVGSDFLAYQTTRSPGSCWSYMQGGFYVLSRELAKNVSQPGGWWQEESQNCRDEDAITGHAIYRYAVERDLCVAALKFQRKVFWHDP